MTDYLNAVESMLDVQPVNAMMLWLYPHSDWHLAVTSGTTDLSSWHEYRNRVRAAVEMCQRRGQAYIVLRIGVQDMLDLLAGKPNTGENRSGILCQLGIDSYRSS